VAEYNQAGLPEWAKERIGTIFGTNVEKWPTGSKLISACDIIPLLSELVSKHGEVSDGSVSWVKRLIAYVANRRSKRRKKDLNEMEFDDALDLGPAAIALDTNL
jgi:hypothetical protein